MSHPYALVLPARRGAGVRAYAVPQRRTTALTLLLIMSAMSLLGCSGSNKDDPFAPATGNNISNRSFTFAQGAKATLAAGLGLAAGEAFTLQFGSVGGTNVAPVSLNAGGSVASGTVTLSPCILRFDRSTFPTGRGPQSDTPFTIDPCDVHRDTLTLRLTVGNGETALSLVPQVLPSTNVALVLTSDGRTGSYAVVDLATRLVFQELWRAGVQQDAIARVFKNRVYVLNRSGNASLQVLTPSRGFLTPPSGEFPLGNDTAPQDIVFLSATKAYVSRLASPTLLVIDPTTLARLSDINLSTLVQPNDPDGAPEPAAMLIHNSLLYIALRHLDRTQAAQPAIARGTVAVFDTATDRLVTVLRLQGSNPASELQWSPTLNRILLSTVGVVASNDGGIEALHPDTLTVDRLPVVRATALGGDITAFVIVSRSQGFAVVRTAQEAYHLATFDPSTGQQVARLTGTTPGLAAHLAINSQQEVYFSVTDVTTRTPGLRIFDATTEREITATPLPVGLYPPRFTLFLE